MIATLSPADINYEETLSTLRYANKWVHVYKPLNKVHVGASHFVLYREVDCSSEVQMY